MKRVLLIGAVIVVALAVIGAIGGSGGSGKSKPPNYPRHFASEDGSSDIGVYQVAWEAMINDCKGNLSDVARYVDNTSDLFAKQGDPTNHLQVMTDIARAAEPIAPTQCDQIAAALLTIAGSKQ